MKNLQHDETIATTRPAVCPPPSPSATPAPTPSVATRRTMRTIDVVGAIGLLVLFSPVMLVVAVIVKLSSPGPVIYRQERIGLGGQPFQVLKFRTMVIGTHEAVLADPELRRRYEQNDFKLPADDPHITRVGRWLRGTSMDELPQLWNVLRGEMGLVGVRPVARRELMLRPEYDQALYQLFKPALTGVWQIDGRADVKGALRIELDRTCLEQWSVRRNLAVLARTPVAVLRRAGAS